MVQRCPDLLADILLGKAPCRWGPHGPIGQVDPASLNTVVLWTKNPRNILSHHRMKHTLLELRDKHGVQISIEMTATGMGGTFIEPGIVPWQEVRATLKRLLAEGWIKPEAVLYRYDPFLTVRTPGGKLFGNADIGLFREVCGAFLDLGIRRAATSRADAVNYPRVVERMNRLGLDWIFIEDEAAVDLCLAMADFCLSRGAEFSVCCNPQIPGLSNSFGCIDAKWLNLTKGKSSPPATEILHNRIGQQRPACRCTYSRDIGYSPGSAGCYSGGFGCLYCYAQGNALPPDEEKIQKQIQRFDVGG
jgi:hypothetical protein